MNSFPAILPARWFALAAFVIAAGSAAAQPTIRYSKPANEDISGKTNVVPPTSTRRNSAAAFNAPSPLFGDKIPKVDFDNLPGSPNADAVSAAQVAQWKKILEGKKNWALMTPEEILNLPTPEKLMGLTDPRDDPKLSAVDKFLDRQDRLAAAGATNGFHHPDAAHWRNDSTSDLFNRSDASSQFAKNLGGSIPGTTKDSSPFFNLNPDSSPGVDKKSDSAWANALGTPEPASKPTTEQLAGMDRFRALMEPPAPEKTPEPSRFYLNVPVAAPDPNRQTVPAFNSSGRSFTALESAMGKPTGITPLPGLTGPRPPPAKKTALVQTPPWLSDTPQPFTPLQRQF